MALSGVSRAQGGSTLPSPARRITAFDPAGSFSPSGWYDSALQVDLDRDDPWCPFCNIARLNDAGGKLAKDRRGAQIEHPAASVNVTSSPFGPFALGRPRCRAGSASMRWTKSRNCLTTISPLLPKNCEKSEEIPADVTLGNDVPSPLSIKRAFTDNGRHRCRRVPLQSSSGQY